MIIITRKVTISMTIGCILFILGETILFRKAKETVIFYLQPFWSYADWNIYGPQIIANVVMFIPLGFLLGKLIGWKGLLVAAVFSVIIELIQLITKIGMFEFDDIIHNTIGALIGVLCWKIIQRLKRGEPC